MFLPSTIGGIVYAEHQRRLIELFPDSARKIWREWELRVLIVVSLFLQLTLILLGNRRKRIPNLWIRIALWSAYLMADSVATVALGVISKNIRGDGDDCPKPKSKSAGSDALAAFWAPFLLLHLGGPDTITAYSLEDNELWLRHLLGLLVQSSVALYIFLIAWAQSLYLSICTIFVLLAGLIKYGERTASLRMANSEQLRSSLLAPPDPGPNYPKFMEEYSLRKAEGYHVRADEVIEPHAPPSHHRHSSACSAAAGKVNPNLLLKAHDLFQIFRRLFVDLILSFQEKDDSQSFFRGLTADEAFQVVELELGFAFDVLYTKTPVVYTVAGCALRLLSFCFTVAVTIAFVALPGKARKFFAVDVIITYLLLFVAILLEIYSALMVLESDWTEYHWLTRRSSDRRRRRILSISPSLRRSKRTSSAPRWSSQMAQYNLLDFCLQHKPAFWGMLQKHLGVYESLEQHRHRTLVGVSPRLRSLIFERFLRASVNDDFTYLCKFRGGVVLRQDRSWFEWSAAVEFDQSILIWHVATDICYYSDTKEAHHFDEEMPQNGNRQQLDQDCEESKKISDYMMYLLVMCPFTLPIGIGMMRFRDTCAEAREFLSPTSDPREGCAKLLQVNAEVPPIKVKGDRSKTVLFDARRMAASLLGMERAERWGMVSQAWVEMLAYAATHCRGNHHAQQLRKGGELLTHVWLLMAHLGITEQFQISQGHARAKLRAR